MEKILVLCAHPDDEALGMGGTIALHTKKRDEVFVVFFADGETSRINNSKLVKLRQKQATAACNILGVKKIKFLDYPDEMLDKFPVLEIAKKIEDAIRIWKPSIVYTHYWGDMNQDHRKIFEATKIATRPKPSSNIRKVICFETPSSTDWGRNPDSFNPNLFIDITKFLSKKASAIRIYKNEIHEYPHPRSIEAIEYRAKYWGSNVGLKNSEAFILLRELV